MSPPQQRSGGPGHHPDTAATAQVAAPVTKPDQRQCTDAVDTVSRTTRIPAGPAKTWAISVDDPVTGRELPIARVRCPGECGGVHHHRVGPPREAGHIRRAPCGEVYAALVVADGRVAA